MNFDGRTRRTFVLNSLLLTLYIFNRDAANPSIGACREAMAINATMAAWHCVWPWMGGN